MAILLEIEVVLATCAALAVPHQSCPYLRNPPQKWGPSQKKITFAQFKVQWMLREVSPVCQCSSASRGVESCLVRPHPATIKQCYFENKVCVSSIIITFRPDWWPNLFHHKKFIDENWFYARRKTLFHWSCYLCGVMPVQLWELLTFHSKGECWIFTNNALVEPELNLLRRTTLWVKWDTVFSQQG